MPSKCYNPLSCLFLYLLMVSSAFGKSEVIITSSSYQCFLGKDCRIYYDSTSVSYQLYINDEKSHLPLHGAALTLSDPQQHGVVYSYISDISGIIELQVKPDQCYFLQVEKEGFRKLAQKVVFSKQLSMKRVTMTSLFQEKVVNFVPNISRFVTLKTANVLPIIDSFQCWLYPEKQKSTHKLGLLSHFLLLENITITLSI